MNNSIALFHGFLGTRKEFEPLINGLNRNVYFIDLYQDTLILPEEKNLIAIGYSMGGRALYHLACQNPQMFSSLIFISSSFFIDPKLLEQRRKQEQNWIAQIKENFPHFLHQWYSNTSLFGPILDNPQFHPLLEEKKNLSIEKVIYSLNKYSITNYKDSTLNLNSNILQHSLVGEKDSLYHNKSQYKIPNAYHMAYFDNLADTLTFIISFLQKDQTIS